MRTRIVTPRYWTFLATMLLLLAFPIVTESKPKSTNMPKSTKTPKSSKSKNSSKSKKGKDDSPCIENGSTTEIINGMEGDFPDFADDVTGSNPACCSGSSVGGVCCIQCREAAAGAVTTTDGTEYDDGTCCTGKATFDVGENRAVCTGFCRRRLYSFDSYEANPSKDRSLKIIEAMGANPDAKFAIQHDILPRDTCSALANYTEYWFQNDDNPVFPFGHENVYKKFITIPKFIEIIGKDNAHTIIDFFHMHRGHEEPITEVYLTRHAPSTEEEMYYTDWHKDCYSAMEVQLGDFDTPQEWLVHLTRNGTERYMGLPGTAMIHGEDIAHGTPPFFGDTPKYLLVIKHHPKDKLNYHPKEVCFNKDIVEDILLEGLANIE